MKNNRHISQFYFFTFFFYYLCFLCPTYAQENGTLPDKVHHAEPLFNDLVRDLGARKGEKEINLGVDIRKRSHTDQYGYLVEYEFAPIHRLGLEIETDFTYIKSKGMRSNNQLERLRLSSQYSFYVSKEQSMTLAVGYSQMVDFKNKGMIFDPFFVAAKTWDTNLHTMIYSGPEVTVKWNGSGTVLGWQINTAIIYTIPHTRHFIGLEVNQEVSGKQFETIVRPQIKVSLGEKIAAGIAVGLPASRRENVSSVFLRLIYEL